eukprot:gene6209-6924_t
MAPEKQPVSMEQNLELQLEEIMREPGVTGVLCTDKQGLPLTAKGVSQTKDAGPISALIEEAALLYPDIDKNPVITLEGDQSTVLIKAQNKIVLSVSKVKSNS